MRTTLSRLLLLSSSVAVLAAVFVVSIAPISGNSSTLEGENEGVHPANLLRARIQSRSSRTRNGWLSRRRLVRRKARLQRKVAPKAYAAPVVKKHYLPIVANADIHPRHKDIANDVLTSIVPECANTLKHFYVRYDKPKHRGLGGRNTIILDGTLPDDEFRAVMIHELGHVIDLGCMIGSSSAPKTQYKDGNIVFTSNDPSVSYYAISWEESKKKKKHQAAHDFISGYGSTDAFEDFAESFTAFMLQRDYFYARAQKSSILAQKYNWFARRLVRNNETVAKGHMKTGGGVPWDITKLRYTWL